MTPAELQSELAAGKLRPAYLVAGAEPLFRDDSMTALREAVLGDGPADFNLDRLDGSQTGPGELIDAVRALPVMAAHRLVILREPEARRGAKGEALTKALVEAIAEVGDQEETVLVVLASKVDKRSRWVKAFKAPAAMVVCDPPKAGKAVVGFIREEAKRRKIRLESGAAEALAEATGPQLLLIRNELEKATLLAGPDEPVTRKHVVESATDLAEEPIWDLTDAIGEGRGADALSVLDKLTGTGAPAPVLLASLAGHFRKLTRARSGGRLTGHPFAVKKLERQAQRYSQGRLRSCLDAIHQVDEVLKGQGNLPADLALQRLVLGLSA